jgi:hypothetical protein
VQTVPQPPQLFESVETVTHTPPHISAPDGHWQVPLLHT